MRVDECSAGFLDSHAAQDLLRNGAHPATVCVCGEGLLTCNHDNTTPQMCLKNLILRVPILQIDSADHNRAETIQWGSHPSLVT